MVRAFLLTRIGAQGFARCENYTIKALRSISRPFGDEGARRGANAGVIVV